MPRVKIRNGNSALLIDESYSNLAVRQSGSVLSGTANSYGFSTITLTLDHDQSVLAVRSSNKIGILSTSYTAGKVTYTLLCIGGSATVEYWNFDLPKYAAFNASHAKLIVRNPANGEKVYDSRLRYMRVINFQYTTGGDEVQPVTTTYASDIKPAMVFANTPWFYRSERVGTGNNPPILVVQGFGMAQMSGSSATIFHFQRHTEFTDQNPNQNTVYPNSQMLDGYWLTLDVSNF